MEINFNELIPRDFTVSNQNYILSRIECYEGWFRPELINYLNTDKSLVRFLINDSKAILDLASQNILFAKNHLRSSRDQHSHERLIDHQYDIDSQVDYLTENEREFLDEIIFTEKDLSDIHKQICLYLKD